MTVRLSRRDFTASAAAAALLAGMPMVAGAATAAAMTTRARLLLGTMSAEQHRVALLPFGSKDRKDWHFTPLPRPGITMEAMSTTERGLLREFLATLLSAQGLEKMDGVMKLEKVLHDRSFFSSFRNPLNYAVVVFGAPSDSDAWAWRFEGHHLSVSATVGPGIGVAATPAFFGANPQT
ncbi:MAG: DUF3500 domain-containing protein, partial [Rhodospirillaceae bacterium]